MLLSMTQLMMKCLFPGAEICENWSFQPPSWGTCLGEAAGGIFDQMCLSPLLLPPMQTPGPGVLLVCIMSFKDDTRRVWNLIPSHGAVGTGSQGDALTLTRFWPGPSRTRVTQNAVLTPISINVWGCNFCKVQQVTAHKTECSAAAC